MEEFIKPSEKNHLYCCWVSYLIHQAFMTHIIWYGQNMVEKTPQFYSEAKTVFYDTIAEYLNKII